jgi:L-alanine-DL-glutamate epimerase-like enolase superfamily enzyme
VSEEVAVESVRTYRLEIPLETPYELAYGRFEAVENAVVRVESESGLIGWGCAAPDGQVTGETIEDNLAALQEELVPEIRRSGRSSFGELLRRIAALAPRDPAARAALDLALHDLWGKERGVPVQALLGGSRREIPTSITIGIMSVEETAAAAAERLAEVRVLKIKGGRDPRKTSRGCALRLRHGRGCDPVDANQGTGRHAREGDEGARRDRAHRAAVAAGDLGGWLRLRRRWCR